MIEILAQLSTTEILIGLLVAVVVWVVVFILLVQPGPSHGEEVHERFPLVAQPSSRMSASAPAVGSAPWRVTQSPSLERVRSPREMIPPSPPPAPVASSGPPSALNGSEAEMKELKAKLDEALKIIRQSGL